ncbi:hypothetical protein CARUB_v10022299mg, partial [Capsella rubella]
MVDEDINICNMLGYVIEYEKRLSVEDYVPDIIIPSMDFTVLNIAETSLSVKWDLVMRIPPDLPGVTIAHSSFERYNLMLNWAQLLNISSIASIGDLDGKVVKDIMED